ncbi:MAG: hypothetical protein Q8Q09_25605 [Deltaproteobacteria bacterium]|nr:hypothetical protein [Deltaproteobacteria bacterium]
MFESFFRAVFGPRGALLLHTPTLVLTPGAVIQVQLRFDSPEQHREVLFLRLHFHTTVQQWTQGPLGPQLQPQTRDLIQPILVSERFTVLAGTSRDFTVQVQIPEGLYPTVHGQMDYQLYAVAPVVGQTIDSSQQLPITLVGGTQPFAPAPGAPVTAAPQQPLPQSHFASNFAAQAPPTAPMSAPTLAPTPWVPSPGVDVIVNDAQGVSAPAMVVEVRAAVSLVQWSDGRAATWVKTDSISEKPAPIATAPEPQAPIEEPAVPPAGES